MAVYKVVEVEDDILRKKCKEITKIDRTIHKLLDNMTDTMYEYKGAGLAAPQIGVLKRVVVIDVGEGVIELVNPRITSSEGSQTGMEGCLSVPGVVGDVTRAAKVKVKALNRDGEEVEYEGEDFLARAFQHELDHLEGVLFIDKADNLRRQ